MLWKPFHILNTNLYTESTQRDHRASRPIQEKIENILFILGFLDAQELDKKSYASILLFQGFVIQIFRNMHSTSWHKSN